MSQTNQTQPNLSKGELSPSRHWEDLIIGSVHSLSLLSRAWQVHPSNVKLLWQILIVHFQCNLLIVFPRPGIILFGTHLLEIFNSVLESLCWLLLDMVVTCKSIIHWSYIHYTCEHMDIWYDIHNICVFIFYTCTANTLFWLKSGEFLFRLVLEENR